MHSPESTCRIRLRKGLVGTGRTMVGIFSCLSNNCFFAEKISVLSLLQQKALVAASRLILISSVGLDWSPPSESPECN